MASRDAPKSKGRASSAQSVPSAAAATSPASSRKREAADAGTKQTAQDGQEAAKSQSGKRAGPPSVPSSAGAGPGAKGKRRASAAATGQRRPRWPRLAIVGVGVVLVLATAGVAVWELRRQFTAAVEETRILRLRVAELEQQVSSIGAQALTDADLRQLAVQVERLTAHQDSLAFRSEVDSLGDSLGRQLRAVEDRLAALVLLPGTEAEAIAMTGQFAEISRTVAADRVWLQAGLRALATARILRWIGTEVEHGRPYAEPLALLRELVGSDPQPAAALAVLTRSAPTGFATQAELARKFSASEQSARAALGDPSAAGLDRLLDRVAGLVEVRRTEMPMGESPDSLLTRVSFLVEAGDLRRAWQESGALPKPIQAELAEWQREAEEVLAAHDALQALERYAAGQLADLVRNVDLEPLPGSR